ncbi:hypothetical protein CCP4SC76_4320003 [Gammaproteobacteria bacterium]
MTTVSALVQFYFQYNLLILLIYIKQALIAEASMPVPRIVPLLISLTKQQAPVW